jgi:pyrroloquinoline quinone (PQQ) biosynthesis protein C
MPLENQLENQVQIDTPNTPITEKIVAVRDAWHTKKHPLFQDMAAGSLDLRVIGIYMAQHMKFVEYALPSFGLMIWRAPADVRLAVIENLAEEVGLAAIPRPGHEPHDHMDMIFRFCAAAGLEKDDVLSTRRTPAWWARALHYGHVPREEPLGVVLAMQATQEGQQVALNKEITLPAFAAHYGYQTGDPVIDFFAEHAEADEEHSGRQMALCEKYLEPGDFARALEVCEVACRLRWESISDIYRAEVLKETPILPPGIG